MRSNIIFDETINEVKRLDELFTSEKVQMIQSVSKINQITIFFLVAGFVQTNR